MKLVAIIQARMGSTRLPGKVMLRLKGKTVLEHVITRVRACTMLDEVVVATTTCGRDDIIVKEAERCGVGWYRGSEEDVLARYYECAVRFKADVIVRITSDCPLFDPELLGAMLNRFLDLKNRGNHVDYLSNTVTRTYPRGLDVEIFAIEALKRAHREAGKSPEREHVTPYIWENPDLFAISVYTSDINLSHHRWTLDTTEDLEVIRNIYDGLYRENGIFTTSDIIAFLQENPCISSINSKIKQKSLRKTH
jgi:spore coat polysaccharide biosynthesis protein SpsF